MTKCTMLLTMAISAMAGLLATARADGINAGNRQAEETKPFVAQEVASFDTPWALAFLPDSRMLVTEKPGHMFLVTPDGQKNRIDNVPKVVASGQIGLLDVAPSPGFVTDRSVYITYVASGKDGSALTLARATLAEADGKAALDDLKVLWAQRPGGGRGQPGGIIVFAPDGQHLFLSTGDRMLPETAQDPDQTMGKVLRLTLDGKPAPDNPDFAKGGARAETWTLGHRNPYGLAFAPDGKLWLHEMGPRGGDELNVIEPAKNYGWPEVSNGDNYSGKPIPRHATRPEFAAPPLYWNPVIAPAGMAFYDGAMFPAWKGSALIGGLAATALIRVSFDGGHPDEADRWDMEARIRDVAVAPDGAVWVIEDDNPGRLLRLVPGKG